MYAFEFDSRRKFRFWRIPYALQIFLNYFVRLEMENYYLPKIYMFGTCN